MWMKKSCKEFITYLYLSDNRKFIQTKDLIILITVRWVVLIGAVFLKNLTTHSILTVLEDIQINFYLTNYQNRKKFIIIKFKIWIVDYLMAIVYTFSIE